MVLNNIVSTNEKLSKIKMTDSPQCTFCKNEIESLEHLFYNCEVTIKGITLGIGELRSREAILLFGGHLSKSLQ